MTDLEKFIADLEEPRLGIHEDGTEALKTWEQLYDQCCRAAGWLKESVRPEERATDWKRLHGEAVAEWKKWKATAEEYAERLRRESSKS